MATQKEIKAWLKKPDADYSKGIQIFSELSKNKFLINQLSRKDTVSNRQKLSYEIAKLSGVDAAPAAPKKKKEFNPSSIMKTLSKTLPFQALTSLGFWKN